jgi:hypothetical protein
MHLWFFDSLCFQVPKDGIRAVIFSAHQGLPTNHEIAQQKTMIQ